MNPAGGLFLKFLMSFIEPKKNRCALLCRGLAKVLLVTVLTLALLEALVRLAGFAASRAAHVKPDAPGSSPRTVLCIGDSFVWGVGGVSFPVQLQDILRERHGAGAFKVINAGRAGTNSSYVVSQLPKALGQYKPDVVIILTGVSNLWKRVREEGDSSVESWVSRHVRLYQVFRLVQSGEYSFGFGQRRAKGRLEKLASEETTLLSKRLQGAQSRSRLVELYCDSAQLYYDRMEQENSDRELGKAIALAQNGGPGLFIRVLRACLHCHSAQRLAEVLNAPGAANIPAAEAAFARGKLSVWQGDFKNGKKFLEQAVRLQPDSWVYYCALGELLLVPEREAAVRYYRKAAELVPFTPYPHYQLGLLYLWYSDWGKAEEEFKQALRIDPLFAEPLRRLADVYYAAGETLKFRTLAQEIPALSRSEEYRRIHAAIEGGGGRSGATPQSEWVADIAESVRIARKAGIPVIVSSYPDRNLEGVRTAAERNGAEYMDLTEAFRRRFKMRQEYSSYDNAHCNTAGYRFMAELYSAKIEALFGAAHTKKK